MMEFQQRRRPAGIRPEDQATDSPSRADDSEHGSQTEGDVSDENGTDPAGPLVTAPAVAKAPPAQKALPQVTALGPNGQTGTMAQLRATLRSSLTTPQYLYAKKKRTSLVFVLEAIDDYLAAKDPAAQVLHLKSILHASEKYFGAHTAPKVTSTEHRRIATVLDVRDRARVFLSQHAADVAYQEDLAKGSDARLPFKFHAQTKNVMSDAPLGGDKAAAVAALHAVVNKFGLSEGELRAIRTYTADNYRYINPAIGNFTPGLASHVAPKDASGQETGPANPNDIKQARLEGAAHAAMAMKGLAKLPAYSGTAYRGFRLDLARFNHLFPGVGGVGTNDILQGTSKGTSVPLGFLSRAKGTAPIEVMMEVRYRGKGAGRDIAELSTMPSELEVLMLPGAKYKVISIEKVTFDAKYSATYVREPLKGEVTADPRTIGGKAVRAGYYVKVQEVG